MITLHQYGFDTAVASLGTSLTEEHAALLSRYTDILFCDVNSYPALIALFGSPVAVSTAVIASEMGGDEQLATQLVVWSSLGSVITIYVTVCTMMACGLLPV